MYQPIDQIKTGIKLKMMLNAAGYSVRDIQEYLHLSYPQSIYRWFKGKILPSGDHLCALSKLLNVHMEELLDADIDDVVAAVNDAPQDYLWNDASPLWLRPQYKDVDAFRNDVYTQVVGHTPVEKIFEKDGIISTDVFSTYRDGRQIGESAMIVIDSDTGKYEKIEVPGKLKYKV